MQATPIQTKAPSYLSGFVETYRESPREAALQWFRHARYGLFLHYGLYSLLERHEWVQLREKIPVAEYAQLADRFTAGKFDAGAIAEFAVACGMQYINLTTRHHDSFCLFRSNQTDFHSGNAPAGRDLVAELSRACQKHGLGLCLYYSHGRDWKHPHAPNNDEWGGYARPQYDPPEPSYATGKEHDLQKYLDFMSAQIRELLTNYGPIAAIWLDGIATPLSGNHAEFKCQDLYETIWGLQPQVLVSYKQGLLGTEDFFSPEHHVPGRDETQNKKGQITNQQGKPLEVCTTMCPKSWGYFKEKAGTHLKEEQVWEKLEQAGSRGYNLLLNTGPMPDGNLDPEDVSVLRAVGERIRRNGFPRGVAEPEKK